MKLRLLKGAAAPLKYRQAVRVLFGTTETFARVHFIDRDELEPGGACVLQLRLDDTAVVLNREPFIIRTYSPMTTIGGGIVLGSSERGYKRRDAEVVRRLETIAEGPAARIVDARLLEAGLRGLETSELCSSARLSPHALNELLGENGASVTVNGLVVHRKAYDELCEGVASVVAAFHESNPTAKGLTKDQLLKELALAPPAQVLDHALDHLRKKNALDTKDGLICQADYDPVASLSDADRALAEEIESAFRKSGLQPPELDDLIRRDKNRMRIYRYLVDNGLLVSASITTKRGAADKHIAFHAEVVKEAEESLYARFGTSEGFTASESKEAIDTTRKFLIPLLECLDSRGFTRRMGDKRAIVKRMG